MVLINSVHELWSLCSRVNSPTTYHACIQMRLRRMDLNHLHEGHDALFGKNRVDVIGVLYGDGLQSIGSFDQQLEIGCVEVH